MVLEDLIDELSALEGTQTRSFDVSTDERGYLDKECPHAECGFAFKVHHKDWESLFKDEAVFCPRCRHSEPSDQWWTSEQMEAAKEQVFAEMESRIGSALESAARKFNRGQKKSGFIIMSMKLSGTEFSYVAVPLPAAEILEQQLQCEECAARYSVLGSAFFCPCCGHNSSEAIFSATVEKIRIRAREQDAIRTALEASWSRDDADDFCRLALEWCVLDCVMAFEFFANAKYEPIAGAAPKNAFQRLQQGDRLWKAVLGKGYADWLEVDELAHLKLMFQRRHVLQHRGGVVDDDYIRNSGDPSYAVGQRLVVKPADVVRMAASIERLGTSIANALGVAESK